MALINLLTGAPLFITALGVALGAIAVYLARPRAGAGAREAAVLAAAGGLLIGGAIFTFFITLAPFGDPAPAGYVDWNPVESLERALSSRGEIIALGVNLLLLSWLGLLWPLVRPSATVRTTVLLVATVTLAIEALQFALPLGRVASAGDVIVNVVGGALAAVLGVRWLRPGARRWVVMGAPTNDGSARH